MLETLTLLAIFTGPIFAVIVTRVIDQFRERRKRKLDVFRVLMRNRKNPLDTEFVGALNLIEVEFHRNPEVLSAWGELLEALNAPAMSEPGGPSSLAIDNVDTSRTKLLQRIGKTVGINIEQLDLHRSGYSPVGWANNFESATYLRELSIDLLEGNRAVLIKPLPNKPDTPQQDTIEEK